MHSYIYSLRTVHCYDMYMCTLIHVYSISVNVYLFYMLGFICMYDTVRRYYCTVYSTTG